VVPKHGSRTDDERAAALAGEVPIDHNIGSNSDGSAAQNKEPEARSDVATGPEVGLRVRQPHNGESHPPA
jgi:hypothetical protein